MIISRCQECLTPAFRFYTNLDISTDTESKIPNNNVNWAVCTSSIAILEGSSVVTPRIDVIFFIAGGRLNNTINAHGDNTRKIINIKTTK